MKLVLRYIPRFVGSMVGLCGVCASLISCIVRAPFTRPYCFSEKYGVTIRQIV